MAPIVVGDSIPNGTLVWFDENDQMQQVSINSLAAGKKVILFGVPGTFTPTCSMQHVPGFISSADELKAKGVDEILRFQRPPGPLSSSMLGLEALTGDLDNFAVEDYLNVPQDSEIFRPIDMHHGMEVHLGLSRGPACPNLI